MKKENFKQLLSDKLGIPESQSDKLFVGIQRKHLVSIENYISDIKNENYNNLPDISNKRTIITEKDRNLASKYQVEPNTISKLREYGNILNKTNSITKVDLSNLSDMQKTMLTQISYLDINEEGMKKIKDGGLKVSELKNHLKNPNNQFTGNVANNEKLSNTITNVIIGKDSILSQKELLDSIIDNKLGNLTITDISNDKNTGFQAINFKDDYNNNGISYRGSNLGISKEAIKDWFETNFNEYITNDSKQTQQATEFFSKNKNENGNNFIYGHSLGGNLTSHTFLKNYKEIKEAFTIDGTPINDNLLDTTEKINAFNSKKYNCNIVAGDVVGNLKACEKYEKNIHYIQNNNNLNQSLLSAHLVQSAEFTDNGNFVKTTKEDAIERMNFIDKTVMNLSQKVHDAKEEFLKTDLGKYIKDVVEGVKDFTNENIKKLENDKENEEITI